VSLCVRACVRVHICAPTCAGPRSASAMSNARDVSSAILCATVRTPAPPVARRCRRRAARARARARTRRRAHARTHARTHARAHARTHIKYTHRSEGVGWAWRGAAGAPGRHIDVRLVARDGREDRQLVALLHRTLGSPYPRRHQDWAHPAHGSTGTGLTPPTYALHTMLLRWEGLAMAYHAVQDTKLRGDDPATPGRYSRYSQY
jgi:hypothetical protein